MSKAFGRFGGRSVKDLSISLDNPLGGKWSPDSASRHDAYPSFGVDSSQTISIENPKNNQASKSALAITKQNATKKLSVAIPKHLHRALKQMALQEDMTMGELITEKLLASLGDEQLYDQAS